MPTLLPSGELDFYVDAKPTTEQCKEIAQSILLYFPALVEPFVAAIIQRMRANGFTYQQMVDNVNHVADTYTGFDKKPPISCFLSKNKRVRSFSYREVLEQNSSVYTVGNSFDPLTALYVRISTIEGVRYVLKTDLEK
jgi:hypothetical protein